MGGAGEMNYWWSLLLEDREDGVTEKTKQVVRSGVKGKYKLTVTQGGRHIVLFPHKIL